jgi:hypothetical protein
MPLERAVVVRGSLIGQEQCGKGPADGREASMAAREVGLEIRGLEALLGLTDATVNLSSDSQALEAGSGSPGSNSASSFLSATWSGPTNGSTSGAVSRVSSSCAAAA